MDTTKTQLTRIGLTQARKHPWAATRISAVVGRHPRRVGKAIAFAAYAQDMVAVARGVMAERRHEQIRARRRARIRKVAIGMSVVGAGAAAGVRLAHARG